MAATAPSGKSVSACKNSSTGASTFCHWNHQPFVKMQARACHALLFAFNASSRLGSPSSCVHLHRTAARRAKDLGTAIQRHFCCAVLDSPMPMAEKVWLMLRKHHCWDGWWNMMEPCFFNKVYMSWCFMTGPMTRLHTSDCWVSADPGSTTITSLGAGVCPKMLFNVLGKLFSWT